MTNATLPHIIYHYTTQEGLLGILRDASLWATKIHYLNDASELVRPLHIANEIVNEFEKSMEKETDEKRSLLGEEISLRMSYDIEVNQHLNICVASFCEEKDLLSQWRAYGVSGLSYCIGFNREKLEQNIRQYSFFLHPCEYYNPVEYEQKVKEFITHVIDKSMLDQDIHPDFIDEFLKFAAQIKLDFFAEEKEWRIISNGPLSFSDNRFDFRLGKTMVIPYYVLPIDLLSIDEIMVGPCPDSELAKDTLHGLAYKYKLSINPGMIEVSKIPYRSF